MAKTILILIAFITVLGAAGNSGQPSSLRAQEQTTKKVLTPQDAIKVTISTIGPYLGPPTNRYKAGEQILVAITMTNTSSAPVNACISSDLYQNLPNLTKDGVAVPYMKWESSERVNAQRDHVCEDLNQPDSVLLKPNEPNMADWFVLADSRSSTGAEAWYEPLPPGKYELTIQRRFACCDGPMVASNKISFEVLP